MSPLEQFLDQVTAFLEYQQEEGVQTVEISPATRAQFLPPAPPRQKERAPQRAGAATTISPAPNAAAPLAPAGVQVSGQTLAEIAQQIRACTACELHAARNHVVPGEGSASQPDLMFIGEGPGAEEDALGKPFVGAAGQLLTKMIAAMGYTRDQVFIANIVKCRPPGNRVPLAEEMDACLPYLRKQIELIRPKIIIALGKTAVEGLLKKPVAITRFRGTWCTYEGIDLMPTFHPAYLLRAPSRKREAWNDLQAVMAKLGKSVKT